MFRLLLLASILLAGCVTFKGSGRWCLACVEITVEGETQPIELPKEK